MGPTAKRSMTEAGSVPFDLLLLVLSLLVLLGHIGVQGLNLSPFCERAVANVTTCPELPTFDIVDIAAYAGHWYEIGSSAQFKLHFEAGLVCQEANYTAQLPSWGEGANVTVLNTGIQAIGPLPTYGVTQINKGSRTVCESARDICSLLGPAGDLIQSLGELNSIAFRIALGDPLKAGTLTDVSGQISKLTDNITAELQTLADEVTKLQRINGDFSQGNGSTGDNVEKFRLAVVNATQRQAAIVEVVKEISAARLQLVEVAFKLLVSGDFVTAVDITEASFFIATAEQAIVAKASQIGFVLSSVDMTSGLTLADSPNGTTITSIPGIAIQNTTFKGKLQLTMNGLTAPYWIIALEGLPRAGYEAALIYSCQPQFLSATIQQSIFIISRTPQLAPPVLRRFMAVVHSLNIGYDCEDPFLFTYCQSSGAGSNFPHTRV